MFRASIPLFLLEDYMNAIQRFFFNIFLFCFGLGLLFFVKLDSFASQQANVHCYAGGASNNFYRVANVSFDYDSSVRYCFLKQSDVNSAERYRLYSNSHEVVSCRSYELGYYWNTGERYPAFDQDRTYNVFNSFITVAAGVYADGSGGEYGSFFAYPPKNVIFESNLPIFYTQSDAINYISTGVLPSPDFDETLELDSFKVSSWGIGNIQALFNSKFEVIWSDPRISVVQVRIAGTANDTSYESSSSPFKGKFKASQFVFNKGDVVHLVATPFKADGSYGTSLYYSFTYSDDIPFSNTYRKLVNTNTNDNTLTIPYSGTSGNDSVTLPVDGVTTNVTYKVNYNPVTNEYGDTNIYEIYYSPVVVYPDNASDQEVDDTQDEIINNYNTTNYYETTKNINLNFDIDFGDISANDIGEGFNGVSGFFNGFGSFIGRLSNWILALFPFLPPVVANVIVFMFGLVIFIAGIALILKIIGAVGNIIDAILPL